MGRSGHRARIREPHVRKIIPAVVAGTVVLAVAGTTAGYAALDKDVTLSVDGSAVDVSTMAGTVGEVLYDQGIALGEHDVVAPAADTRLRDGTRIAVRYGRPLTVTVDGRTQTYWTTATTVDEALARLPIPAKGAAISTSRSAPIGRAGLSFRIGTAKIVTLETGGAARPLRTTAVTVGAALAAAGIEPDADDQVVPAAGTALRSGAKVRVVRVDVTSVTKRTRVAFRTVKKRTDTLTQGDTTVDQQGRRGIRTTIYREVRHDGAVRSRTKVSSSVTTPARDEVVLVGTRDPSASTDPAPSTDPSPSTNTDTSKGSGNDSGSSRSSGGSSRGNTVWDRLAQCESGQRWNVDTGNGYYGGLQFAKDTWRAYGGTGLASEHTREEQIAIAKKVQADVGWGAWPACSRKLGLR